jgi:hypothetical protein
MIAGLLEVAALMKISHSNAARIAFPPFARP